MADHETLAKTFQPLRRRRGKQAVNQWEAMEKKNKECRGRSRRYELVPEEGRFLSEESKSDRQKDEGEKREMSCQTGTQAS